jgi:DNA-binding response OmpR family regulator
MRALWISDLTTQPNATARGLATAGLQFDQIQFEPPGLFGSEVQGYDLICVGPHIKPTMSMDALSAVTRTERCPPVIFIASEAFASHRAVALERGAADVIDQPVEELELRARVVSVLRRAQKRLDGAVEIGDLVIDVENRMVSVRGFNIHLSETEYAILEVLANRSNRRVSRETILCSLFGRGATRAPSYLRFYVHNIRKKLRSASSDQELVAYRGEEGYALLSQHIAPN